MLTVTMRDAALRTRGQLRCTSVKAVIRKNGFHTFVLDVSPEDRDKMPRFKEGWGVIIEDDGLRLSGPAIGFDQSNEDGVTSTSISGVSDLVALADRLTLPAPTKPVDAQDAAYYTYKGPAETAIKNLVDLNAGPGALPSRRTFGLKVANNLGRGGKVNINTRLKNLLEEAASAADAGGLVLDCVQTVNKAELVFDVRPGADKSRRVRLTTGADEVISYENKRDAPKATAVIVGGQGEGADRNLVEVANATGWGGRRIEIFKDRRDTDEADNLQAEAQKQLAENAAKIDLTFQVRESAARKLGADYQVGDTVAVELEHGVVFVEQITSATVSWQDGYRTVELTVGNTDDDKVTSSEARRLAELSAQLLSLQAK